MRSFSLVFLIAACIGSNKVNVMAQFDFFGITIPKFTEFTVPTLPKINIPPINPNTVKNMKPVNGESLNAVFVSSTSSQKNVDGTVQNTSNVKVINNSNGNVTEYSFKN
ncbi:uncharacterized protein LOC106133479 [Amyelois transitella]|uniref:uncharacterized protein LOC106133479 n=1 Tax=Amyelois transitella TaxID=680683 RepID=UPI00067C142E|nr:uncharacterized protein LOC106133479 [Amyelois transitella]